MPFLLLLHLPVSKTAESSPHPYTSLEIHKRTHSSIVSTHQLEPGLPLDRHNRLSGLQIYQYALILAQHSTPQYQQVKQPAYVMTASLTLTTIPTCQLWIHMHLTVLAFVMPRLHLISIVAHQIPLPLCQLAGQHPMLLRIQQPQHRHYQYLQHQQQLHERQQQAHFVTGFPAQLEASQPSQLHLQPPQQLPQEATDAMHWSQQRQQQQQQHRHSCISHLQQQQQQHCTKLWYMLGTAAASHSPFASATAAVAMPSCSAHIIAPVFAFLQHQQQQQQQQQLASIVHLPHCVPLGASIACSLQLSKVNNLIDRYLHLDFLLCNTSVLTGALVRASLQNADLVYPQHIFLGDGEARKPIYICLAKPDPP